MEHALTKECRESIAMDFENPSAKHPSKNVNSASRVTDRQTVQFLYIYINGVRMSLGLSSAHGSSKVS